MEGYLLKWTNYIFGWQRRYFILSGGILQYCKQKGSAIRGVIHLDVSQVIKHAKNNRRFSIDTGLVFLHLKADSPEEAKKWFECLSSNRETSASFTKKNEIINVISEKIAEMCSIHAQILSEADLLQINFIKTTPGLDRAIALCEEMKEMATETLGIIETQEEVFTLLEDNDYKIKQEAEVNFFHEETGTFFDAKSQVSDSEEVPSVPFRKSLPFLRDPNQKINIWKVIKDSIGLELSRIAVPVYFNEPLSFLQRFSEDLSYNSLIVTASEIEDSALRLAYIATFIISTYNSSELRTMKPFNPLLGETFDLERDEFKLITEQVSHHPPVSALHCDHRSYTFFASTEVKTSFKGTYLKVHPIGTNHLILKNFADHFVWEKPFTNVHNIIMGKIYVEHYGNVEIKNLANGEKGIIQFKRKGWFDKSFNDVTGTVYDANGVVKYSLEGKWNKGIRIKNGLDKEIFAWEPSPYLENYEFSYYFSEYALQLNLPPEVVKGIAPTDSRYRPDQRALEQGDIRLAGNEKLRLEEKQRAARKTLEQNQQIYQPRWFKFENDEWQFKGDYWDCKERGCFDNIPDIY